MAAIPELLHPSDYVAFQKRIGEYQQKSEVQLYLEKAQTQDLLNKAVMNELRVDEIILDFNDKALKNQGFAEFVDEYFLSEEKANTTEIDSESIATMQGYALNWQSKNTHSILSGFPVHNRLVIAATNANTYGWCMQKSVNRAQLTNKLAFDFLQTPQSGSYLIDTLTTSDGRARIPLINYRNEFVPDEKLIKRMRSDTENNLLNLYITRFPNLTLEAEYQA